MAIFYDRSLLLEYEELFDTAQVDNFSTRCELFFNLNDKILRKTVG